MSILFLTDFVISGKCKPSLSLSVPILKNGAIGWKGHPPDLPLARFTSVLPPPAAIAP